MGTAVWYSASGSGGPVCPHPGAGGFGSALSGGAEGLFCQVWVCFFRGGDGDGSAEDCAGDTSAGVVVSAALRAAHASIFCLDSRLAGAGVFFSCERKEPKGHLRNYVP